MTIVAICLAGAAGLACGGEATAHRPSAEALAKVRASDYARAVNLHASDVPYFEPIPDEDEEDREEAEKRNRELMTCVGVEEDPDRSPKSSRRNSAPTRRANSSGRPP